MYISDACKAASTTKKAIEYYCEKGLIKPAATENGYRLFSEEDVARLKKISALRPRECVSGFSFSVYPHGKTSYQRNHEVRARAEGYKVGSFALR